MIMVGPMARRGARAGVADGAEVVPALPCASRNLTGADPHCRRADVPHQPVRERTTRCVRIFAGQGEVRRARRARRTTAVRATRSHHRRCNTQGSDAHRQTLGCVTSSLPSCWRTEPRTTPHDRVKSIPRAVTNRRRHLAHDFTGGLVVTQTLVGRLAIVPVCAHSENATSAIRRGSTKCPCFLT